MQFTRPVVFAAVVLTVLAVAALPFASGKALVIDVPKKASVDVCIAKSLGTEYLSYYDNAKTLALTTAGTTADDAIPDINKMLNNYRSPQLTPATDLRVLIKENTLTRAAFEKYAYGLIPFATPGIALGALSLIFTLFFLSKLESLLIPFSTPDEL